MDLLTHAAPHEPTIRLTAIVGARPNFVKMAPILEEAGGTFTDWRGNPSYQAGEGVATNGLLLPEVLPLLQA